MPVAVSWHQAQTFCAKLSALKNERPEVRLPTEAEWEYACRAGSAGPYGGGLDPERPDEAAWHDRSSEGGPRPVARKEPNAWGLYDMHGNMLEWCRDWYDARYYLSSPERDPAGPASGTYRVLRGGSWADGPEQLKAAARKAARPDSVRPTYGMRACFEVLSEDPDRPIAGVNVTLLQP
jgi:formylglycine-generating enzyme required for sulfatase activity